MTSTSSQWCLTYISIQSWSFHSQLNQLFLAIFLKLPLDFAHLQTIELHSICTTCSVLMTLHLYSESAFQMLPCQNEPMRNGL